MLKLKILLLLLLLIVLSAVPLADLFKGDMIYEPVLD